MTAPSRPRFRCLGILTAIVAGGLLLAACATAPSPKKPAVAEPTAPVKPVRTDIRVGVLLPLSGGYGDVGQSLLNAASLALFDAKDNRLVLIPRDTSGTAEGATAALTALLAEDVDVILGPLLAPEARAAAPQAAAAGVPMIAFSSDTAAAVDGAYLLSFLPEEEVRRTITYAASQGHKKFAALLPDTPYGQKVQRAFLAAVLENGGAVTDMVTYPPDTARLMEPARIVAHYEERRRELENERKFLAGLGEDDLAEELLHRLAKLDTLGEVAYDALLIAEGGGLLRALAPLMPYFDVDPKRVKFLGTGLWNDAGLAREPQLQGGWFAAPDQNHAQAFLERYRGIFRSEPPRIATLAYDAMALVTSLAGETAPDTAFARQRMQDPNGFIGIDGIFRFRPDGTAERGLAVMTITNRGLKTLSPAPNVFPAAAATPGGQETTATANP
ncbi:MAG: penicillin-binding protein activator [Sphingomonadales bacterium]|nr:penicillin-binding protein activator [Sphingomonadales bacterium]